MAKNNREDGDSEQRITGGYFVGQLGSESASHLETIEAYIPKDDSTTITTTLESDFNNGVMNVVLMSRDIRMRKTIHRS